MPALPYSKTWFKSKVLEAYQAIYSNVQNLNDVREIYHYSRNENQTQITSYEKIILGGFRAMSDGQSALHRLNLGVDTGNENNSKWTSQNGLSEYVFRYGIGQFELVDSALNMGTFNYASPVEDGHVELDVYTWLLFGNSEEDASNWTYSDRRSVSINALKTWSPNEFLSEDVAGISFARVEGEDGIDYLISDGENNHFLVFGGNDKLFAGSAEEIFDGGIGSDTVSYKFASSGITLNLKAGMGYDGYARGDNYIGVENIDGSKHGDIIVGDGR